MWHSPFAKPDLKMVMIRNLKWLVFLPFILLISGCGTVAYYSQMINGHLTLMSDAKPVDKILSDPATSPKLKNELKWAKEILRFAVDDLKLPDNGSYRKYVQLNRPYVLWNVVAAPKLSLKPKTTCSPVAGCVAYRGYYHHEAAENYAAKLQHEGYDTYIGGVAAYSTVGWFRDPLVSSMMYGGIPDLAGIIFHELGHQEMFTKSDTSFTESFATVVETEGVRRWLMRQKDNSYEKYLANHRRYDQVIALMLEYRQELEKVYVSNDTDDQKLQHKREIFTKLHAAYEKLKAGWGGYTGFDKWMTTDMNNAKLASIGNYHQWVPSFEKLLRECNGDLPCFYTRANALAKMKPDQRQQRLRQLAQS